VKRVGFPVLLLLGCGGEPDAPADVAGGAPDGRIECAVGGTTFERACRLSREGERLTIHHPDGGFRRLLIARDGRGVVAADGAEQAEVAVIARDRIEVALGSDRYRLPATVQAP